MASDPRIQDLLKSLLLNYADSFRLELAIYIKLRGRHNRENRKQVARLLNLPDKPYNVVEIADHIRANLDKLRYF